MAGYHTIRGEVLWYDARLERLSSDAWRLHDFCLHGPGRSMVGVRRFTCADILARVPAWSQAVAEAALAELVAAGLVLYDPAARLLFARTFFDHAPVKGPKQVAGACKALAELPDSPALVPALRHVLAEMPEARRAVAAKAAEALASLETDLRVRLARLEECSPASPDTPSEGYPPPVEPPEPSRRGPDTPSEGYRKGIPGGAGPRPEAPGAPARPPGEGVSGAGAPSHAMPDRVSGVDSRARGRAGAQIPNPYPEPDPPQPPRARASPPGWVSGGAARESGREGARYANLDPRKR